VLPDGTVLANLVDPAEEPGVAALATN